ncbi:uncharacterized protein LOC132742109 [Ruditapes philippinarum]|uniref:uncharacterized protein LOC132742109 n=1 Tax=Ruditapes philippinarum TaxID=129788 RepID=UPI00295B656C|nr:uncharacterized protein LOC132742109 [Ruditapes philippinarum]
MKGTQLNLPVLATCLLYVVNVQSLRCWHCIAEDCAEDPSDNYKASEKLCNPGQSCQKVYFEMLEESDEGRPVAMHTSTVRGCSTDCMDKNDFTNCTHKLKTSRGCVRKDCCNDGDLCNSTYQISYNFYSVIFLMCLHI